MSEILFLREGFLIPLFENSEEVYFPLWRLVCKLWKNTIDKKHPKKKDYAFCALFHFIGKGKKRTYDKITRKEGDDETQKIFQETKQLREYLSLKKASCKGTGCTTRDMCVDPLAWKKYASDYVDEPKDIPIRGALEKGRWDIHVLNRTISKILPLLPSYYSERVCEVMFRAGIFLEEVLAKLQEISSSWDDFLHSDLVAFLCKNAAHATLRTLRPMIALLTFCLMAEGKFPEGAEANVYLAFPGGLKAIDIFCAFLVFPMENSDLKEYLLGGLVEKKGLFQKLEDPVIAEYGEKFRAVAKERLLYKEPREPGGEYRTPDWMRSASRFEIMMTNDPSDMKRPNRRDLAIVARERNLLYLDIIYPLFKGFSYGARRSQKIIPSLGADASALTIVEFAFIHNHQYAFQDGGIIVENFVNSRIAAEAVGNTVLINLLLGCSQSWHSQNYCVFSKVAKAFVDSDDLETLEAWFRIHESHAGKLIESRSFIENTIARSESCFKFILRERNKLQNSSVWE